LSNKKSWSSRKSLDLGFGHERQGLGLEQQGLGLGLGLEQQGLGLGLEQQDLGLGLDKKVLVTALSSGRNMRQMEFNRWMSTSRILCYTPESCTLAIFSILMYAD